MKRVVIGAILVGFIGLNAKTTSLYEHARALRMASQKEVLEKQESKKEEIITKKTLEERQKEYSKN